MPKLYVVNVGSIKTSFWRDAAKHYRARLAHGYQIEITIIKDEDAARPADERKRQEGERILAALPAGAAVICLDEHGESMSSPAFAAYLQSLWDKARPPCFVTGGAYGLADEMLARAHKKLAWGAITLPHELAQVVLWEQLFRADAILRKTGYHH